MSQTPIGVLLMAYGAAGSLEEVEPYLQDIRGGRPVKPELVEEIKRRYRLMGGKSPLLEITRLQAAALERKLNETGKVFSVRVGMRHWHPYIKDTVASMAAEGLHTLAAVCLTPYYSKLSVGTYFQKLDEAVLAAGASFDIHRVESWNDRPPYIEAVAEKITRALDRFPSDLRKEIPVLFTAHSLPERILAEKDPYPDELLETVGLVMERVGSNTHRFAYQSPGRTPEPWLGPDAAAVINEMHAGGVRNLLMAPIGFISDHMETLYDVDVLYRDQCLALGLRMERAESLNESPALIGTLAEVVHQALAESVTP